MLPALYDEDRRALARLATMLATGALCILPLTTQSSPVAGAAGIRDVSNGARLVVPARLTFPAYEVNRDPFVPDATMRSKLDVALPPTAAALQGGIPVAIPAGSSIGPVLRAVVLGDPPRALVEAGGMVRVLGVGDRLGDRAIVGITAGRVTFSDGSALILDGTHK
jgi:hypothetical protein